MTQRLATAMARKDFASILRKLRGRRADQAHPLQQDGGGDHPQEDLTELEDCQKSRAEAEDGQDGRGKAKRRTPAGPASFTSNGGGSASRALRP